jgi:hypothetical protein
LALVRVNRNDGITMRPISRGGSAHSENVDSDQARLQGIMGKVFVVGLLIGIALLIALAAVIIVL